MERSQSVTIELFKPVVDNLLGYDPYMLLADCRSYVDCQEEVGRVWRDCERWTRASILNSHEWAGFRFSGRVPAQGLTSNSGRAKQRPGMPGLCRAIPQEIGVPFRSA